MRHIKLVIFLAILIGGAAIFMKATSNNSSVRGQDPNVEARGTNTAGLPAVGTSGATEWQGDSGFVTEAAEMGATEVALADLAGRRATSADVKAFAARLRRDHTAASAELNALASRKQWTLPASIDTLQAEALRALDRSQTSEFDRAYADAMVTAHERALAAFRNAAGSAADPDLKAWAAKQIPTLEQHLDHARRLRP